MKLWIRLFAVRPEGARSMKRGVRGWRFDAAFYSMVGDFCAVSLETFMLS